MPKRKAIEDYIRAIPDFPKPGIMFRDVTTLFNDPRGFRMAVDLLLHPYAGLEIDRVAGLEARGFIFGGAVAATLGDSTRATETGAICSSSLAAAAAAAAGAGAFVASAVAKSMLGISEYKHKKN